MTDINTKGKKAKPIKPDFYYKERNKLNNWLLQFEFYFSLVNKGIKDKEKVIFTVSHIRGKALNQINTDIIKYIDDDNPDDDIKEQIKDFGKFKKRIKIIFSPANEKASAENII